MASTPYPLPRQTRESSILVGNGTVGPYGPTTFKVFDILDIEVWAKATGEDVFSLVPAADYTVAKTAALAFDTVSVTFDATVPSTTSFVIRAARTAERTIAVTRAGAIAADELEKELSKIATTQSEIRRDMGRAVRVDPGQVAPAMKAGTQGQTLVFDADGNLVPSSTSAETVAQAEAARDAAIVARDASVAAKDTAVGASGTATTQAGTATTQAGIATTQAGIATTQAGIATTQAGIATTRAAEAATSVAALPYAFSTSTVDADPGAGTFRLNNATIASATAAYIDNSDADAVSQATELDSWDDSTTTVRGKLTIRSKASPAIKHVFNVTGTVVDGTGYRKLTLAYVGGAGALTAAMDVWLIFDRTGDAGAGTGDVVGPASAVSGGFAKYNGTTGKLLSDGGTTIATADIGNSQVTPAKLDNGTAVSILGRSANSSGARADIAAGADDRILARTASALSFTQLTAGMVPAGLLTFAMLASAALASNAEMQAGTASKILTAAILRSAVAYQTLTDGASIAWDMASGNNALVVLAGNRTLSNMGNPTPQFGFVLKVTATTSTRTLTLSANYIVAVGVEAFPISITTAETVYIVGFVDTAGRQIVTGVIRT